MTGRPKRNAVIADCLVTGCGERAARRCWAGLEVCAKWHKKDIVVGSTLLLVEEIADPLGARFRSRRSHGKPGRLRRVTKATSGRP